eukprot:scaffold131859_cov17-Prasinocladus_malaysianus.AAC.1
MPINMSTICICICQCILTCMIYAYTYFVLTSTYHAHGGSRGCACNLPGGDHSVGVHQEAPAKERRIDW